MDDQRLQWRKPGSFLLVAGVFLAAAAAVSNAGIGEFDEHWEKRRAAAEEVYKPDPYNVTNEFNHAVIRHAIHTIFVQILSEFVLCLIFCSNFELAFFQTYV